MSFKKLIFFGAILFSAQCFCQYDSVFDRSVNVFTAPVDTISEYLQVPNVPRLDERTGLKKEFLEIGNVKLYVQIEGQGIPVVLIHGGPGSTSHYFHPWFEQAAKFCKVIYYDQRGCGLSEFKTDSVYTIDQSVEDLENLRKKLQIKKWVVLGHSYGGLLAQYYSTKHPEAILGLILVSTSLPMDMSVFANDAINLSDAEQKKINEIWSRPGKDYSRKIYNAFINGDWKRQHYFKPTLQHFAQIALYQSKSDTVYNTQIRRSLRNIDLSGYFITCPIPTMIMEGRWDMLWLRTKSYDLRLQFPNAQWTWFENSAHSPFANETDKFFEVLKAFITNLKTVSPSSVLQWTRVINSLNNERKISLQKEKQFLDSFFVDYEQLKTRFSANQRQGIKTFSESSITSLGLKLFRAKEFDKAIKVFEMAIQAFPTSANLYEYLGDVYKSQGDKIKALENYKKAFRLNPYEMYLLEK